MDLSDFRQDYQADSLDRDNLRDDPFEQFELWFTTACDRQLLEPNAMTLATVSADGKPAQRTVLLKSFDRSGFVFFTNYGSRKAQHMGQNPWVSLLFAWLPLQRQVEIGGRVEKVATAESLRYFTSRPRGSQLGAWCSPQSRAIESREFLLLQLEQLEHKFAQGEIPLPDFWGGYRVVPERFEFWQGRSNRLHDRFEYGRSSEGWKIQRLAP